MMTSAARTVDTQEEEEEDEEEEDEAVGGRSRRLRCVPSNTPWR
jgi:hypothetical protein